MLLIEERVVDAGGSDGSLTEGDRDLAQRMHDISSGPDSGNRCSLVLVSLDVSAA